MNQHTDKRKYLRYPCLVPMALKIGTGSQPVPAHMVNCSEGGICIDVDMPISLGALVEITIQNQTQYGFPGTHPFNLCPTRVCWRSHDSKDETTRYNVGLEYID